MPRRNLIVAIVSAMALMNARVGSGQPAAATESVISALTARLGVTETQAQRGLGALLVLAQERLAQQDFEQVAVAIPSAQQYIDVIKLQGVVTRPIDDGDEFRRVLAQLRINDSAAARFGPTVCETLATHGAQPASDLIASVLD